MPARAISRLTLVFGCEKTVKEMIGSMVDRSICVFPTNVWLRPL